MPAPRDTAAGDWELVEDVAAGHSTLDPVVPSNGSKPGQGSSGVPSSSSSILPSECLPLLFLGPAARHSQSRERRPGGVSRTVNHPPLKPPSGAAVYIVLQTEFSQEPRFFQSFGGSATASRRRVRQEVYCKAAQVEFPAHLLNQSRARILLCAMAELLKCLHSAGPRGRSDFQALVFSASLPIGPDDERLCGFLRFSCAPVSERRKITGHACTSALTPVPVSAFAGLLV